MVWRRPNRTIVRNTIRSPVYAGIYAYGHKHTEYHGAGRRERAVKDPADWLVYLPGRLPAYISVEWWQRNLARLEANRNTATTPGSPPGGDALLAGLLRCGKCGKRRMGVYYRSYQGQRGYIYHCSWEYAHYGGQRCQELAGACLDEHITNLVLTAIAPASLELSLHAAEQVERDRAAVEKIWSQRLERVDRARRAHHLAEPENRLVVRQLEAEWEQALADREKLREDDARFTAAAPRMLSPTERETIRELAADLPGLWHAPTTTVEDRKHLLRLLIEQVAVRVIGESEQVGSPSPGPAATAPPAACSVRSPSSSSSATTLYSCPGPGNWPNRGWAPARSPRSSTARACGRRSAARPSARTASAISCAARVC
ncbi:recombinase zinc beta ribbon domain-containing protein [Streptomyces sp. NPDC006476]|uniref:recombinase family protein n=1 Tax=Streptomyces sp. NPDC006476 TaxID=3157175 RepID=UPI00339F38A4